MKVWLCSDGSYSDYGPRAIYSTKEAADIATRAYGWSNDPVEYDLDPELPQEAREGMSYFCVCMWWNGDVPYEARITELTESTREDRWQDREAWSPTHVKGKQLTAYCWARDAAHAIKIANERRIIRLASGE